MTSCPPTQTERKRKLRAEWGVVATQRVARKRHAACFGDCPAIQPGDVYAEVVIFPGHDACGGTRPLRGHTCAKHALYYGYDIEVPWEQCVRQGLL